MSSILNEYRTVVRQKIAEQRETRVHHAQPLVVMGQVLRLRPDNLPEPLADFRAVDVVVVDPVFVAGVVRRVDVDALDLARVVREQSLESE